MVLPRPVPLEWGCPPTGSWFMLRLSKKAEYALMALKDLASRSETEATSAREIAERYGIPVELMAKVLQRLVRRDLLASHHGTRGGYQLARPSGQISVAEVIEAIDGPLSITQCVTVLGNCDQFDTCNIRSPLHRLNDQVIRILSGVTIATMCEEDFESLTENLGSTQLPVIPPLSSPKHP